MTLIVADCPRCGANSITFDVKEQAPINCDIGHYEIFSICRACKYPTIFQLILKSSCIVNWLNSLKAEKGKRLLDYPGSLNTLFEIIDFVSLKNNFSQQPPAYLPVGINDRFKEGLDCFSIGCYNAAGTMFRLCLDMTTRPLLPTAENYTSTLPTKREKYNLGPRLDWLFENNILPKDLQDLAHCVREDGNDGAHEGTLTKADAENLLDFAIALLERLFTEPKKIELAKERRNLRRIESN